MTRNFAFLLTIGLGLSSGLAGCSTLSQFGLPIGGGPAPSPSEAAISTTKNAKNANKNSAQSVAAATKPRNKTPLTVQKLKNTEYFILAERSTPLKNGKFQDQKKRTFTLGEVVAYGDLNRDGIKDAVGTIDLKTNDRTFTYLVGVINDNGSPKNVSAEFLGEQVKVKELSANAGKITVKIDKFGPNDPACCPSQEETRGYSFKPNQPKKAPANTPSPAPSSTKSSVNQSPANTPAKTP